MTTKHEEEDPYANNPFAEDDSYANNPFNDKFSETAPYQENYGITARDYIQEDFESLHRKIKKSHQLEEQLYQTRNSNSNRITKFGKYQLTNYTFDSIPRSCSTSKQADSGNTLNLPKNKKKAAKICRKLTILKKSVSLDNLNSLFSKK